jgi:Glyoxalase-like domain
LFISNRGKGDAFYLKDRFYLWLGFCYFGPLVQNLGMRLDHVSYVTSHDQLSDTVQRLGAVLSSTFVDGGIHPSFGTRNFTCALMNGQYLEIVCPLDHPATEQTPWGQAVSKKAYEGGGWFTWVFSTRDITPIAIKFGRDAVEAHRTRPNGTDLKWKQIGVKEIADTREFPFFIQWLSADHPSQDGTPIAEIKKIVIADKDQLADSWFKDDILASLGDVNIEWVDPAINDDQSGIVAVHFSTPSGVAVLD